MSLKRKAPLVRKTPLRSKSRLARSRLRSVSKSLSRKLRTEYAPASKAFLADPRHAYCEICLCLSLDRHLTKVREWTGNGTLDDWSDLLKIGAKLTPSSEVHHRNGRTASLLADSRFFIASDRRHREWPHENPRVARLLGLLAPASEWNVVPR